MWKALIPVGRAAAWISLGGSLLLAVGITAAALALIVWAAEPVHEEWPLLAAQVSSVRLEQGQVFVSPYLVMRWPRKEETGVEAEYQILDGFQVRKRIPRGRKDLISVTDQGFALAERDEAKRLRVEIYDAKGDMAKTLLFPIVEERLKPTVLLGDKLVAIETNIHTPVAPYDFAICSMSGERILLKDDTRTLEGTWRPCGTDRLYLRSVTNQGQLILEVLDSEGKLIWSQTFPAAASVGETLSLDGKFLVISSRVEGVAEKALVDLSSGKKVALPPGRNDDCLILPQHRGLVMRDERDLTCVGFDGQVRWKRRLGTEVDGAGVLHVAGQPSVACVGLNGEAAAYEMRCLALADGAPLGKVVIFRDVPQDSPLRTRARLQFHESAPGRLLIRRNEWLLAVDLNEEEGHD